MFEKATTSNVLMLPFNSEVYETGILKYICMSMKWSILLNYLNLTYVNFSLYSSLLIGQTT